MISADARWVLTFNGEIYNYKALRRTLEADGARFASDSDTEVILNGFARWGVKVAERLQGMFAFAVWDEAERRLYLVRDRLGIKPLYFAERGGALCFASELTAILGSGVVDPEIDKAALQSYLRLLWIPDPNTLLRGIHKVPPAHILVWDGSRSTLASYWDLPARPDETHIERERVFEDVRRLLAEAVISQLQSDVPVGAFLSGGLDSTSLVALASRSSHVPVRTYSIRFPDAIRREEGALDDAAFARLAARKIGADHYEIDLTPDVANLLPLLVRHLEDPIADPAAINAYLICSAAKQTSTVLLSGTGGDELFGGYRKYVGTRLARLYSSAVPRGLRAGLVRPLARALPVRIGPVGMRPVRFLKKFVEHASASAMDTFLGLSSYYDAEQLSRLLGCSGAGDRYLGVEQLAAAWISRGNRDIVDCMTYVDMKYYLPGLGLAYMDKASMAASVEVRVPLLDDSLVNFVGTLPSRFLVAGGNTKVALRGAMCHDIPKEILRRPKAPFSAPIRSWLRKELAVLVHESLAPGKLISRGLFDPDVVRRMLEEHTEGQEDHSLRIWALITLESWIQQFLESRARFNMSESCIRDIPVEASTSA